MKRFKGINQFYLLAMGGAGAVLAFTTYSGEYKDMHDLPIATQIGCIIMGAMFVIWLGQLVAAKVFQLRNKRKLRN